MASLTLVIDGRVGTPKGVRLVEFRKLTIRGHVPGVQELVEAGAVGFLVRSSEPDKLPDQAITLLSSDGKVVKKIGSFGEAPGTYYALKQIAVSKPGTIWALDMMHRVTRFSTDGQFQGSNLLQSPGYVAHSLALDESRGVYYIAGCVPIHHYVDLGCLWVHQYSLIGNTFRKSFLQTEDLAVKNHYLALEDYSIDVSPADGSVYVVDPPIRKFWRVDPGTGAIQAFSLGARNAPEIPALDPTKSVDPSAFCLAQRIFVLKDFVVVSVRLPGALRYVLEVFSLSGDQIATDLPAPGTPVGKAEGREGIWFLRNDKLRPADSFELVEGALK